MSDGGGRYRAVPFDTGRISRDRVVVVSPRLSGAVPLDAYTVRVLKLCVGKRTLDQFAADAATVQRFGGLEHVRPAIDRLVASGLLQVEDGGTASSAAAPDQRPAIDTLGVVTADRPDALRRCLESYLANCAAITSVVVVDSSRSAETVAHNRRAIAGATTALRGRGGAVQHLAADEHEEIRQTLKARAIPPSVVDFALRPLARPFAPGAARNLLCLATTGRRLLSADDDTVCRVWRPANPQRGVAFCGHAEPRETQFFESRATALAAAAAAPVDLLDAHGALLGRTLEEMADAGGDDCDYSLACDHLAAAFAGQPSDYAVRLTMSGIAGDSAAYCRYVLLFSSGATRAAMGADRRVYDRALGSREVLRIVSRPTIAHDGAVQMPCVGVDNRGLLPPFMPFGANEDGLFGSMVRACDPRALFGHVAHGIVHDSARPSAYDDDRILSASQLRLADVLAALIPHCPLSPASTAVERRMRQLGTFFCDLAAVGADQLRGALLEAVLIARTGVLAWVDTTASSEFSYPDHWRRDLERYRETLLRHLDAGAFLVPVELADGGGPAAGLAALQVVCRGLGELLQMWPDIRAATGGFEHVGGLDS